MVEEEDPAAPGRGVVVGCLGGIGLWAAILLITYILKGLL